MSEEHRDDLVLAPGEPRRGNLIIYPYHVGIVICNGKVEGVFPEGTRRLPRGDVRTYVASTAPFNLTFWLQDPGDPSEPGEGMALDQPVLTADGQLVTGRIDLTLSVVPDNAEHLLQLLSPGGAITRRHVADSIKSELLAKVLALDLHTHTAGTLRGNRDLFQGIYASLEIELASTISRYGLKLDNFYVNWGLIPEERERIKEERHQSVIRDIERESELERLGGRRPGGPGGGGSSVGRSGGAPGGWFNLPRGIGVLALILFAALIATLLAVDPAGWFDDSPDATPVAAATPQPAPTSDRPPAPAPAPTTEDIQAAVAAAIAQLPQPSAGPSMDEVAALVSASVAEASGNNASPEEIQGLVADTIAKAMASQPQPESGPTRDEIAAIIAEAIPTSASSEGPSPAEIQAMIQQAIASLPQPTQAEAGPTSEEIDAQIQAALSSLQPGMTPEQVQAAVQQAVTASIASMPTPTPAPTPAAAPPPASSATPAPTATPTAAPTVQATPTPTPATEPREAELVWSYDTESEVWSSPAVSEEWDVLYVGASHGYLYALDTVTGQLLWRYGPGATTSWRSWPVVVGKTVYTGGNEYYGTDLLAVEAGEQRWDVRSCYICVAPIFSAGSIYVGSSGSLYALDAATGAQHWYYRTAVREGSIRTRPSVVDKMVYFGADDKRIYALTTKKGELIWSYATNAAVRSSPTVADGIVYAGSNDDHLYAVNAEAGEFIWRYRTGGDVISSPAVANGIVYVGSNDGSLYALDATTGTLAWSYETGGAVVSSPAVSDGVVYVGSYDGFLYALDAATGSLVWSYETEDKVASSPAVSGDNVYVGSVDGHVYAFRK